MKHNHLVVFLGLIALIHSPLSGNGQAITSAQRPNIILILTDDQGFGDVGFNGCRDIPTPNIDRIAANGVVFSQGYVSYCVCGPSRAGLMTGRYQDRFGFSRNPLYAPFDDGMGLPPGEQTMAAYLQQAGYTTMAIGKWHLGAWEKMRPWYRGFNHFFGFLGGGHRYFPEELVISHQDSAINEAQSYRTKLVRNREAVEETAYLTDAFSREAVQFVRQHAQAPFFLYLAYNAPHSPLQATEKYLQRFAHLPEGKRRTYAAMVSAVDDGVGALLDELRTQGIEQNTLVIFLSDNGGPEQDNGSDNGPLRGAKGSLFEGGIRVPFAMLWPSRIKAGSQYHQPVISLDIFATIAANLPGAPAPANPLDGVNLLPYLTGLRGGSPHEYLFWRQFDQRSYAVVQAGGFKSLVGKNGQELFYLPADTAEQRPLSDGERKSHLVAQQQLWERAMVPPAFLGLMQEAEYRRIRPK